jgi:hypothetical protein
LRLGSIYDNTVEFPAKFRFEMTTEPGEL